LSRRATQHDLIIAFCFGRVFEHKGATVHQTEITVEEFQDLLVDLDIREESELGGVLSITGWHPDLGRVVALQDGASAFLHTARPLSFSAVADTYLLETAIARMVEVRTTLQRSQAHPERPPQLSISSGVDSGAEPSKPLRGMLTWLGVDPDTASAAEMTYAREAVAHVHEMAALPANRLAELHTAMVGDLKKLVSAGPVQRPRREVRTPELTSVFSSG
jgi:hypothetical protein